MLFWRVSKCISVIFACGKKILFLAFCGGILPLWALVVPDRAYVKV